MHFRAAGDPSIQPEQICMIGDRLLTDVVFANKFKMLSILVRLLRYTSYVILLQPLIFSAACQYFIYHSFFLSTHVVGEAPEPLEGPSHRNHPAPDRAHHHLAPCQNLRIPIEEGIGRE